jgi:DNA topoisomerase VI subunit A
MSARKRTTKKGRDGKNVVAKLSELGADAVKQIHAGKNPNVEIPLRTLANVKFDPKKSILELGDETQSRSLFNVGQARKYMQTMPWRRLARIWSMSACSIVNSTTS